MQHRWGSGLGASNVGFAALLGGVVALLGCASASGPETGLRTNTEPDGPAGGDGNDLPGTDGSGSDGPVGDEPPAVDGSGAGACVASADFVPLGVIPQDFLVEWKVIDPRARHVFFEQQYTGNESRSLAFRWSEREGVVALDADALRLPATDAPLNVMVWYASLAGDVALGVHAHDAVDAQTFRWTAASGAVGLDFFPDGVSQDAQVAVGKLDGRPVLWTETSGTTELARPAELLAWSFDVERLWMSATGDQVFGIGASPEGESYVLRWSAASGWVNLGVFQPGVAGLYFMQARSDAGDVVVGVLGNPVEGGSRAFRWTEASGSIELGVLADMPPEASYTVTHISSDGSVVVGSAQLPREPAARIFRWTQALGMQDLMPGAGPVYPSHVSARGDVVIARKSDTIAETNDYRWTEAGGVEELDLYVRAASADGNLLAGARQVRPALAAFPGADSASPSLAELAPLTIVPRDWSQARVERASADGRLIAGIGIDPQGERQAWLLRRTERCAAR